ncbi:MAG: class I SAM-dependent methyltransferase, partial [Methanomassiliicoccales archaeon]|nr:class I SAM-dependent methyltransferase [Methanomassiliicoccales archaeon]
VLELGCGDGKTIAGLLGGGRFVVGIDHSTKAIGACNNRYGPQQGLSLAISDVCALPFSDGSFDTIVASHILEHLMSDDRTMAVAECRRVLRPGGRVIVRVFSVRDMRHGKGREIERDTFVRGNSIVYHCFSKDELRSLFQHFKEKSLEERKVVRRFEGEDLQRVTLDAVFQLD